jgi:aminoglycoside phosphotransferase (APT) family kinase protein
VQIEVPDRRLDLEGWRHLRAAAVPVDGALTARLIAGGRSNLTFHVQDDRSRWILRRPPVGHVLATAHDMSREHVVLRALAPTTVPTPARVHLCEDVSVIGAPFLLVDDVDGPVVLDRTAARAIAPADARRASETLVDVLAEIHEVPVDAVGLAGLGRPDGFLARQLRRWRRQCC